MSPYELLWAMNPNLSPHDIARLREIQADGRRRCEEIIAEARKTMQAEEFAQFLASVAPVLEWM